MSAAWLRVGLGLFVEGEPAGAVLYDARRLHGAACRLCDGAWTIYDEPTFAATALAVLRHLDREHGALAVVMDASPPSDSPAWRAQVADVVAMVARAWDVHPHGIHGCTWRPRSTAILWPRRGAA